MPWSLLARPSGGMSHRLFFKQPGFPFCTPLVPAPALACPVLLRACNHHCDRIASRTLCRAEDAEPQRSQQKIPWSLDRWLCSPMGDQDRWTVLPKWGHIPGLAPTAAKGMSSFRLDEKSRFEFLIDEHAQLQGLAYQLQHRNRSDCVNDSPSASRECIFNGTISSLPELFQVHRSLKP